jgi:RecB family endonuclease NucS
LEDWLSYNLQKLEVGLEFVGRQYETNEASCIDILAKDSNSNYVVIELKRDKASDVALGQLLRYLGWARMHLGNGNSVRGFVIGDEIDDRMVYAILSSEAVESLCKLKQYGDLGVKLVVERSADNCLVWIEELTPATITQPAPAQ